MVSSIAVLFGVPRSNGAMVALWAANLEPHEFIRGSSQNIEPTVIIDAIIKPIYNFKAGDGD